MAYESGDSAAYHYQSLSQQMQGPFQEGLYQYFLAFDARRQHLIDSALSVAALSEANLLKSNDSIYLPKLYRLLMEIYIPRGDLDAAMTSAIKSEKIYRQNADTLEIAYAMASRGVILHDLSRYAEGVKVSKEAIRLLNLTDKATNRSYFHAMNIVGINFDDWNKPDSALFYYYQIVNRYEEKINEDLARVYNNMANTYKKTSQLDSALKYIKIAHGYNQKTTHHYQIATTANNVGSIYQQLGKPDSAFQYLTQGLLHADSSGSVEKLRDSNYELMVYYRERGDLVRSMDYLEAYHQLKDSLFKTSLAQAVAEIETKYETEKKDKAIRLLTKENELQQAENERNIIVIVSLLVLLSLLLVIFYLWKQRAKAKQEKALQEQKLRMREAQINAAIQSEEKERKRFAADLHDSMGQLITALRMNLQGLKLNDPNKVVRNGILENADTLLSDIQKEIRNIAFNLMPPVLTKEGLLPALAELINRINRSNTVRVELNTYGLENRMNEVYEISLYRVLQEWISNVLKYSGATYILIDFTGHDDEVVITVEDNGQGFDVSVFDNSQGNGWRNINSRLNLLNAEMEIDSVPGRKNTTLTIRYGKKRACDKTTPGADSL